MIRITKTKNMKLILDLNHQIMPEDHLEIDEKTTAWIVKVDGEIAGFCTLREIGHHIAYLDRGGVLPKHQGKGIHRRLIAVRERYARSRGMHKIITYVMPYNYPSMFTLVRCNYLKYKPEYPWAGTNIVYFIKELK